MAGIIVPVLMYGLSYGFMDAVRQYPFEYHDYLSSGVSTVRGTSLELFPIVMVRAGLLGAAMGYLGGRIGRRWFRISLSTSQHNKPLQPVSGANGPLLHSLQDSNALTAAKQEINGWRRRGDSCAFTLGPAIEARGKRTVGTYESVSG